MLQAKEYINTVEVAMGDCSDFIKKIVSEIVLAHKEKRRVWILGNGGSLAIAQHLAQDLLKLCDVKAQTINDPSILTAYSNDDGFEFAFYRPLSVLSEKDDVILIFSCSGNSKNYVEFCSSFGRIHKRIYSVTGCGGGFLSMQSENHYIKSDDYQVCELSFCVIADLIVKGVMDEIISC